MINKNRKGSDQAPSALVALKIHPCDNGKNSSARGHKDI